MLTDEERDAGWEFVLTHEEPVVRAAAAAASQSPELRRLYPFASHSHLRFSRVARYPFDWDLPYIASRDDGSFEARTGENRPIRRGDLASVVAAVVGALPKASGKVACPRCGQDWLVRVRLVHLDRDAILCPECDALWQSAEEIGATTFEDYGTFMMRHGRPSPDEKGEFEILETLGAPVATDLPRATTATLGEILRDRRAYSRDEIVYVPEEVQDVRLSTPALVVRHGAYSEEDVRGYRYFLELSVIAEVLEGLESQLALPPTPEQCLRAVAYYAEHDAYPDIDEFR